MALPLAIRNTINARLAVLAPLIRTRQEAFRDNHGRYWQGLVSHAVIPADGIAAVPDRLAQKPSDEQRSWSDGHDLAPAEPMAVRIDTYAGRLGKGYVVTVLVRAGAETWQRCFNEGPEEWRDRTWERIA